MAGPFWRVLPWVPAAPEGAPFSTRFVPPAGSQTGGRFDLGTVPVLYLGESPEHALAETLQRFRGRPLRRGHLRRRNPDSPGAWVPLALVEAQLPGELAAAFPDLGDPAVLQRFGVRPDHLASGNRRTTQAISRSLHDQNLPGFRWWSALRGDWHVTVLFLDRIDVRRIVYGQPDPLSLEHPTVRATAPLLQMPLPAKPS